ncbi:MAG: DUF1614 domain-containing protein [Bacteroides sp.]|nr:DUF1614 domain-containing protein [Prevotella sp.]MCM1407199.1 DUF1614 domain-containing protein [Treponema brennaborense]MCM1470351.1 DUF1614 domain-containing protein [Bacteroides sp.]
MNKATNIRNRNTNTKAALLSAQIRNIVCICGLILSGCVIPIVSSVYLFKKSGISAGILLAVIITSAATLIPSLTIAVRAERICLKHKQSAEHRKNKQLSSLPANGCFGLRYLPICANGFPASPSGTGRITESPLT